MVLWKKESTSKNACYIDLLFNRTADDFDYKFSKSMCENMNKKSDIKSIGLRMQGNQQFKEKKWREAMELYNQSLRYATDASENISLAYANRSVCFLQLQKYDQCLADIELAEKANYPERLMHKLDERKAKCLKLMIDEPTKAEEKVTLALSFDANVKFPCLANAIKVQHSEKFGKSIVATRDINVGQIVLVEEMFITSTHSETLAFCKTCLKSGKNFIPCRNCNEFIFCDTQCLESNVIHKMSCNRLHDQDKYDSVRIVESVLIAVTAFQSIGSLMEFVECALSTRDFDTPKCSSDVQSKYSMFLKLELNMSANEMNENMKRIVFWSYQMLLEMPEIKRRIHSKREKRFIMHMILQHHLSMSSNGTLFHQVDEDGKKNYEVSGTGIFESLLDHACFSNATFQRHGNQIFVYAIRPVKKGERLTIHNAKVKSDNQCKCSKCVPKWKQSDLNRFESEPDYQSLMQHHTDHIKDSETRHMLMAKMVNLLQKYGRLPWTPEFEGISMIYDHCMHAEYSI